jgi:isopropylmalate/homocitrate/citramalate synthase
MVDRLSGMHSSPLKPVTGFNVYSHESGVHVDGMLKDPRSYEHLPSSWTAREPRYVLGKSSGVALIHHLAKRHGVALSETEAREILHEMKSRILSRSREAHARIDAEIRAFRERELTGIPEEEVLAEIEARTTRPASKGRGLMSAGKERPTSHSRAIAGATATPRKRSAAR